MREVSKLSPDEQKQLTAYLVHLRMEQDTEWRSEMARRIDDRTASSRIDLQDWKSELGKKTER